MLYVWVAPLVGAWIEICRVRRINMRVMSLLSWERGLKFALDESKVE